MKHATTVLRDEHEIVKQVMVLVLSQTVVFALERTNGVMVGTHTFRGKAEAPDILGRLGSVFPVG